MSRLTSNDTLLVAVRRLSVSAFAGVTLLLAACGGGSGSAGTESSRLNDKIPYTEDQAGGNSTGGGNSVSEDDGDTAGNEDRTDSDTGGAVVDDSNGDSGTDDSVVDNAGQDSGTDTGSDSGGVAGGGSVDGGSSEPETSNPDTSTPDTSVPDTDGDSVVDGGNTVEPDTGVDKPDSEGDSGLLEEIVSEVSGAVRLEWDRPEYRENGEYLEGDEIGGYELRYRRLGEEEYQTVIVKDGWDEDYELGQLVGSYQFSIAAFDNNGLYSEFVSLSPVTGLLDAL